MYDQTFWQRDTASVFNEVIEDAKNVLSRVGVDADDETAFNMFNSVVLSYAWNAYDQPKMREFVRMPGSEFPWPSALSLLSPLSTAIYRDPK